MSENIFILEYSDAQKNLNKQKWINLLVKIFTLGFFNNKKRVSKFQILLTESKRNLDKYNELCDRANTLTNSKEIIELDNLRMGANTFSSINVSRREDYGSEWEIIREVILTRDNYQCQEADGYCNGALQVHHITPLTKGGTNDSYNLVTLCLHHHSLKHEHMKRRL